MTNEKRLIYADELRQTIESKIYWGGTGLLEAIDEAPTVDAVEVVHGRWVEMLDDVLCSKCGHSWNIFDNCAETFNYCHNCGAKMDGGNEDG